jgi:hypothetical protein
MKKRLLPMITVVFLSLSCDPEPCTTTIETINGPQTIEIDCGFEDDFITQ